MERMVTWYRVYRLVIIVVLILVTVLAFAYGFRALWSIVRSFVDPNTVAQKTSFIEMVVGVVSGLMGVVGGLVLVVGLLLNFRGQNQNQSNTLAQIDLTRRDQVTEHFTKAIEQLGEDKKRDIRLGGIYALRQIADQQARVADRADARVQLMEIIDILASYLREHATYKRERTLPRPDYDIEAVLNVIKGLSDRHKLWEDEHQLRLDFADLYGVDVGSINLEGAGLGGTYLQGANLRGAHLEYAYLQGAHLENADLSGAHLELADLRGAHLEGANLSNAKLIGTLLEGTDLQATNFQGAVLEGKLADDVRAKYFAAYLNANFAEAFSEQVEGKVSKAEEVEQYLRNSLAATVRQEQIRQAIGNDETVLPSSCTHPEWWKKLPNLSPDEPLGAGNYSIILGKTLLSFSIDGGWYAQFGWLPYHFSLSPTSIGHAGPQLTFVHAEHVFDPDELKGLEPEKYREAIQRKTPDIDWFRRNTSLHPGDSKQQQDSVGEPDLPGAQLDASVNEGTGKDIPGYHQPCIPLFPVGRIGEVASLEGNKIRIIVLNAEGVSLIILVESSEEGFDAFLEKAIGLLKTVKWPDPEPQHEAALED